MRDMFTHKITTPHHWNMIMTPTAYTRAQLDYDLVVGNVTVTPAYDPMCATVTDGCAPAAVISESDAWPCRVAAAYRNRYEQWKAWAAAWLSPC